MKSILLILGAICIQVTAYDGAVATETVDILGYDPPTKQVVAVRILDYNGGYNDENGKPYKQGYREINFVEKLYYFHSVKDDKLKIKRYCEKCRPNIRKLILNNDLKDVIKPISRKITKLGKLQKKILKRLKKPHISPTSPNKKCKINRRVANKPGNEPVSLIESTFFLTSPSQKLPLKIGTPKPLPGCNPPKHRYYWFKEVKAIFVGEHQALRWMPGSGCNWESEQWLSKFFDTVSDLPGDWKELCFS